MVVILEDGSQSALALDVDGILGRLIGRQGNGHGSTVAGGGSGCASAGRHG